MRDESVSIAKGIAITLMVLVHARFSEYGGKYINMFHMPLFFFFSGYCFKETYLADFKKYITKKINGIYIPFVKWCIVFLLLHNLCCKINIYNIEYGAVGYDNSILSITDITIAAFHIITRMSDFDQLLGGYWFLGTIFYCSLIGYLFLRIKKVINLYSGGVILCIISLVMLYIDIRIPYFGIGAKEFLATIFFLSGYLYKRNNWKIENYLWIIPISIVALALGTEYWQCAMGTLTWQKFLPYIITAMLGTLMIFAVSKKIEINNGRFRNAMIYIGNNTLTILTWHFLSFKIINLLILSIYGLPIKMTASFPVIEYYAYKGWWIAYFAVGMGIPLLFSKNRILR